MSVTNSRLIPFALVVASCVGDISDASVSDPTLTPTASTLLDRSYGAAGGGANDRGRDRARGRNDQGAADGDRVALGRHIRGIDDDEFELALDDFNEVETAADGLGPVFNEAACGNCHNQGAAGGAGVQIERRYGTVTNGVFDPLDRYGGSLLQLKTLGAWTSGCKVPLEAEPSQATIHNVGRLTTPLFGLGLVDAMPDAFFQNLAASQPAPTRGIVNMVGVALPDPSDPSQSVNSQRVGRFGWKANGPNLVQFAADAYLNEMGITTQHCFRGQSITTFAVETKPNGVSVSMACEDGRAGDAQYPGCDDMAGECTQGATIIQDDVASFTRFMTFLAPPRRDDNDNDRDLDDPDSRASRGRLLFDKVGCAACHTRQAFVTPDKPTNGVPGGRKFYPFSDFLLHDMGNLGDQIGNAGDRPEITRRMRTAPLWGIRFRTLLLHDGRARDVASAVTAHNGQAAAARRAFGKLNRNDRSALLQFIKTL